MSKIYRDENKVVFYYIKTHSFSIVRYVILLFFRFEVRSVNHEISSKNMFWNNSVSVLFSEHTSVSSSLLTYKYMTLLIFSIIWQREGRHTGKYVVVLSNAFDKLSITFNVSFSMKRMDIRMISIGSREVYMRVAERLITVQYDTSSWRSQIQHALTCSMWLNPSNWWRIIHWEIGRASRDQRS